MTILQQLILEISRAIALYQLAKHAKEESISEERQQQIILINQVLEESEKAENDQSAYRLRKRLLEALQQMPAGWLGGLIHGNSLRQQLLNVLDQSEFSENELLAQEAIELRQRQQMIGTAENGDDLLAKLDLITEELKKKTQQAQLAMASSDQYQLVCADLGKQCQGLIDKNQILQQELDKLQTKLTKQLASLKTKLQAQRQLVEKLNEENRQLRLDKEVERQQSIRLQKKLDEVTPQYTASLETIAQLHSLLKKHGIPAEEIAAELQTLQPASEVGLAESSMELRLEVC